jgi:hypothetical protein
MEDYGESRDKTELRERLFAGATLTACLFSFISCLSLVIVVPTISENAISLSERMYENSRHCNVSFDVLDKFRSFNKNLKNVQLR